MKLSVFSGNSIRLEPSWEIVLVEVHMRWQEMAEEISDTPIPCFACVVSDEGSISRSATEQPRPIWKY